jgi:hypothetical protein
MDGLPHSTSTTHHSNQAAAADIHTFPHLQHAVYAAAVAQVDQADQPHVTRPSQPPPPTTPAKEIKLQTPNTALVKPFQMGSKL